MINSEETIQLSIEQCKWEGEGRGFRAISVHNFTNLPPVFTENSCQNLAQQLAVAPLCNSTLMFLFLSLSLSVFTKKKNLLPWRT